MSPKKAPNAKPKEVVGGYATRSIHAGEDRSRYADSITTPIVQTSTYVFKDSKEVEAYTKRGKARFEYGRYGNPTEQVAARRLAALEAAEDCVVFSSGMSAITTTILALVKSNDHIVITDDAYKKTLEFCNSYLLRFGVECTGRAFRRLRRTRSRHTAQHPLHLLRIPHQPLSQHLRPRSPSEDRAQTQRAHPYRFPPSPPPTISAPLNSA